MIFRLKQCTTRQWHRHTRLSDSRSGSLAIGSEEHQRTVLSILYRYAISNSILPAIEWPELDEVSLKLLHSLPVWAQAMETERMGDVHDSELCDSGDRPFDTRSCDAPSPRKKRVMLLLSKVYDAL